MRHRNQFKARVIYDEGSAKKYIKTDRQQTYPAALSWGEKNLKVI